MDQALEATAAFAIFIMALTVAQYSFVASCASAINQIDESSAECIADVVASAIIQMNGNSSEKWWSWSPQTEVGEFLEPAFGARMTIKAACYRIGEGNTLETSWVKGGGAPVATHARCLKAIILDDRSLVRIEVYVYR